MFNVDSDNQITAVVPAGATSGPVTVTDRAGQATSAQTFQVIEPPVIQSFTPTSGPKGTTVTARGRHLLAVTAVKFTGTKPHRVNASFKVVDTRTLTTVVPPDAVTGPIYARNPAGVAKSQDVFMVTS